MNPVYLSFFLITAGINSVAQLLLKRGSFDLREIFAANQSWPMRIIKILLNPFVFAAVVFLGTGMLAWIWLISKVELSKAYPVNIALTIVITSFVSIALFNESLTLQKLMGTGVLILGLWLILGS